MSHALGPHLAISREAAALPDPTAPRCHRPGPRRILFVIDTLCIGGAEQSLVELCRTIDRSRFEPIVCHLYPGAELAAQISETGTPVYSLDIRRKYAFGKAFRRLSRLIQETQPDLIHTMLYRSNQVGRAAGRRHRLPLVSSFVNVPYDAARREHESVLGRIKLSALRWLDRLTSHWVHRFHSVSQAARDSNCRALGIACRRVHVIPRGRPTESLRLDEAARGQLLQELGLSGKEAILLNVGRLVPQKGQRTLLDAMARLVRSNPEVRLLIAGEGVLRGELERQIVELGLGRYVRLLGYRRDVPLLFKLARCLVLSSTYEGLPGAVIEAMLAQCPVVASDLPMLDGLIRDRVTGRLVPPSDSERLAEALSEVLSQPEEAFERAKAARSVATESFDSRRVTRAMEEFWQNVLEERTASGARASSVDAP